MTWFVYILACSNQSYYIGHTHDLSARLSLHQHKKGAQHTAVHTPSAILYQESFPTELAAIRRERQLKRWSRAKKEALNAGDKNRLHELSKSRD
jgi:predicted GIY-YIG superfamily endonuclease